MISHHAASGRPSDSPRQEQGWGGASACDAAAAESNQAHLLCRDFDHFGYNLTSIPCGEKARIFFPRAWFCMILLHSSGFAPFDLDALKFKFEIVTDDDMNI